MTIRWAKYKNYAGLVKHGEKSILSDDRLQYLLPEVKKSHVERAFLVTFMVESGGRFGSVMSYDGTAMTAGACQNILVYPAELAHEDWNAEDDQGSLGRLLCRVETIHDASWLSGLWELFETHGWYLAQDGRLRWLNRGKCEVKSKEVSHLPGDLVHGAVLRDVMTGPNGVCPKEGPQYDQAADFVSEFSRVFSDDRTFPIQIAFEQEHILRGATKWALKASQGKTIQEVIYGDIHVSCAEVPEFDPMMDLAMCLFWSNSVNAPAKAKAVLERVLRETDDASVLARNVVLGLGNENYARWDDDVKGSRYQRTRSLMMQLDLWPESFFSDSGIMPEDLPG